MTIIKSYWVEKFYPPRCPKCEHDFRGWDDLTIFYGENNPATSLPVAMANWWDRWPEIWIREPGKLRSYSGNPYELDFVRCRHCGNVTMRILHSKRQVMTQQEADELIEKEGFTFISQGSAGGIMARPFTQLGWLAKSDLAMLEDAVREGRLKASASKDERIAGDIFAATIDKALTEIVKKNLEAAKFDQAEQVLRGSFGQLWDGLDPQAKVFLITAELLKDELSSYAQTNESVDFSPVVQSYSKALERSLLQKVFLQFATSPFATKLPAETGKKAFDNSIQAFHKLVTGGYDITLGSMAFCLLNVGCKLKNAENNGFAEFLQSTFGDLNAFCDTYSFPARLNRYVETYRNRAAHVTRLTKEDCLDARAFLLEEPVKLLVLLEQFLTNAI